MTPEESLREATRLAREALKDLKRERAEVQRLLDSIPERVEETIGTTIRDGLEAYKGELREATDRGVAHVLGEFEKLKKAIMGGTRKRPSLIKIANDPEGFKPPRPVKRVPRRPL